jgi:hypothetical protein
MVRRLLALTLVLFALLEIRCKDETIISPGPSDRRSLVDPAIMPQPASTYPPPNGTGPFQVYSPGQETPAPHFFIVFNKLMHRDPIRTSGVTIAGFDLPVYIRGTLVGSGTYSDVFSFVVYDSVWRGQRAAYQIGRTYSVTLDTTIVDINGNHLQRPHTFSFKPEPSFRVAAVSPMPGSVDQATDEYITITFNSRVDSSILPSASLLPLPPGAWRVGEYSLSFYPEGLLSTNTVYRIGISAAASDTLGNTLGAAYTSSFVTRGFGIRYMSPGEWDIVAPASDIYVSFSAPLDPSSVPSAFSIDPPVPGTLLYEAYGTNNAFRFEPTNGFAGNRVYTVTVMSGVRSITGDTLPSSYVVSFSTDSFSLTYHTPGSGENYVARNRTLSFHFSGVLDSTSTTAPLTASPEIPGQIRWGRSDFELIPSDSLLSDRTYVITVNRSIRSAVGDTLPGSYGFVFTTAP